MNVTVIGTGFVGVVSAGVFAKFGNLVYGLDVDPKKIAALNQGRVPFYEPGLEDLIKQGLQSKNLSFTTDYPKAIKDADIIIIAVGTPSGKDGQADLKFVMAAARSLAPHLKPGAILAIKSTVPPGINPKLEAVIKQHTQVDFFTASLPEFLKEGSAVYDALHPDRVVIGAYDPVVSDRLLELHQPLASNKVVIKPESAQMSKYAGNAYLAQRITFINQIANLCEKNGADIQEVVAAMGHDRRIGEHYWYPGLGYGGSCFPKDVKELASYAKSVGQNDSLFIKIDELNEKRIPALMDAFAAKIGSWKGKQVAVLGLSFKPNTDDMREAPSRKVIPYLQKKGAEVIGFDPKAAQAAQALISNLKTAADPYQAAKGADATLILIEWPELVSLDLPKLKNAMRGNVFIDTRNQYDPREVRQAGLEYLGVGR